MPWDEGKSRVSMQMDKQLYERIKEMADREHRTIAGQIVWLVERGLLYRDLAEHAAKDKILRGPSQPEDTEEDHQAKREHRAG